MLNELVNALQTPSPVAYLAVFVLGIFVSFGSCTILELPILLGYLGGVKESSRARLFGLIMLFVSGMLLSYLLIGLIIGYAVVNLASFAGISTYVYVAVAVISFVFGLYLLGFIRISIPWFDQSLLFKSRKTESLGALLLGFLFVFFEAPTCPSCAPALLLIASYMLTKGTVLVGVSLLMTYVAGQAVPLIVAGTFAGFAKNLGSRFHAVQEYVQVAAGIILVIVSLDLLWLA